MNSLLGSASQSNLPPWPYPRPTHKNACEPISWTPWVASWLIPLRVIHVSYEATSRSLEYPKDLRDLTSWLLTKVYKKASQKTTYLPYYKNGFHRGLMNQLRKLVS